MNKEDFEQFVSGSDSNFGVESLIGKYPILERLDLVDEFKSWYRSNGIYFEGPITNILQSDSSEFINLKNYLINEEGGGLCFNNAQRVFVLDNAYSYLEGFYCREEEASYHPIHEHGFNVKENQVMDFTATLAQSIRPFLYFGILIPKQFVEKCLSHYFGTTNNVLNDKTMLSLIVPYFLFLNGYEIGTEQNKSLLYRPTTI